jgi:hypothetical protein
MKTPQEKKRLSLKKDRRNTYGENNKSSRTGIPLRKAKAHRRNRHRQDNLLHKLPDPSNEDQLAELDNQVKGQVPAPWRKYPDTPLGEVLERQNEWRIEQRKRAAERPFILKEAVNEFMMQWFDAELRNTRPPEYVSLEMLVEQDLTKSREVTTSTQLLVYELMRSWQNRV